LALWNLVHECPANPKTRLSLLLLFSARHCRMHRALSEGGHRFFAAASPPSGPFRQHLVQCHLPLRVHALFLKAKKGRQYNAITLFEAFTPLALRPFRLLGIWGPKESGLIVRVRVWTEFICFCSILFFFFLSRLSRSPGSWSFAVAESTWEYMQLATCVTRRRRLHTWALLGTPGTRGQPHAARAL
jgi:hypothetical protein